MAQTVDFSPSNSVMKLIGSDLPVQLRDGEQSSSYILALTRGLLRVKIKEFLILKACFVELHLSSSSVCTGPV